MWERKRAGRTERMSGRRDMGVVYLYAIGGIPPVGVRGGVYHICGSGEYDMIWVWWTIWVRKMEEYGEGGKERNSAPVTRPLSHTVLCI